MEENTTVVAEEPVTTAAADVAEAVLPKKKEKRPINQQKLQDNLWGWAFCVPLIVGTVLFVYIALVMAVLLSFTTFNSQSGTDVWGFLGAMFSGGKVGPMGWETDVFTNPNNNVSDPLRWYKYAFSWSEYTSNISESLGAGKMNVMGAMLFNTVFYLIGIPIGMVLSMFFAVCMSRDIKGGNVFRVIYYLPCVASTISIVYTFRLLFASTESSVINQLLGTAIPWMGAQTGSNLAQITVQGVDPFWTQGLIQKCVVIVMAVWKGLGGTIILYIAGLSGVNAATKEAAQIDGASGWRIFWQITMPDLYPVIFYNMVTAIIGGMQIYAEPELFWPTTGAAMPNMYTSGYVSLIWWYGTSGNATLSQSNAYLPGNDVYFSGNAGGRMWYGLGAAYGIVLAIIVLVMTLFQFWLDKRKDD